MLFHRSSLETNNTNNSYRSNASIRKYSESSYQNASFQFADTKDFEHLRSVENFVAEVLVILARLLSEALNSQKSKVAHWKSEARFSIGDLTSRANIHASTWRSHEFLTGFVVHDISVPLHDARHCSWLLARRTKPERKRSHTSS